MRILVLNNDRHFAGFDFHSFFSRLDSNCVVKVIKKFSDGPDFDARVEHFARDGLDAVVSVSEAEIYSAARIRERYGIKGQLPENSVKFRDKFVMKQEAEKTGLAVPAYCDLKSPDDARRFAKKNGFPLALKPRDSVGALGVRKAIDDASLEKALVSIGDELPKYICEAWIDGDLFHIDGYVVDGAPPVIWPSGYSVGCYEFAIGEGAMVDWVLAETRADLVEYTRKLLGALELKNQTFHAEVFVERKSGRLVLCEIASRTGGDLTGMTWAKAFKIDLNQVQYMLHSGLGTESLIQRANEFQSIKKLDQVWGQLSFSRKNGVLASASFDPPVKDAFIVECVRPHGRYVSWQGLSSFAALLLVGADSDEDMLEKCKKLEAWFEATWIWRRHSLFSFFARAKSRFTKLFKQKKAKNVIYFCREDAGAAKAFARVASRHRITGLVLIAPPGGLARTLLLHVLGRFSIQAWAWLRGIPIFKMSGKDASWKVVNFLAPLEKDFGVVSVFPRLIPDHVIQMFPGGMVNIHPSLLPRRRGPLPEYWQFRENDPIGGVTVHTLAKEEDRGSILAQTAIAIEPQDDLYSFTVKAFDIGGRLASMVLDGGGDVPKRVQSHLETPSRARKVTPTDVLVDWNEPAEQVLRSIQAALALRPVFSSPAFPWSLFVWLPVAVSVGGSAANKARPFMLDSNALPAPKISFFCGEFDFGRGRIHFAPKLSIGLIGAHFFRKVRS